jgi:hypothetical protein
MPVIQAGVVRKLIGLWIAQSGELYAMRYPVMTRRRIPPAAAPAARMRRKSGSADALRWRLKSSAAPLTVALLSARW